MIAAVFLRTLIEAVPYKIHKILTGNGLQFTHIFERVSNEHGIEHRKTKPRHPRTHGQVECMNRTLKEATVCNVHYTSHDALKQYLQAYLMAYSVAKRLKVIKRMTPWQFILNQWIINPE
jgi:transposase InsO family protein